MSRIYRVVPPITHEGSSREDEGVVRPVAGAILERHVAQIYAEGYVVAQSSVGGDEVRGFCWQSFLGQLLAHSRNPCRGSAHLDAGLSHELLRPLHPSGRCVRHRAAAVVDVGETLDKGLLKIDLVGPVAPGKTVWRRRGRVLVAGEGMARG